MKYGKEQPEAGYEFEIWNASHHFQITPKWKLKYHTTIICTESRGYDFFRAPRG